MAISSRLFVIAIFMFQVCPLSALGAMELYLTDASGDAHQVEITPGQSFEIQVGFATTEASFGLSYWLNVSENGNGGFALTNRTIATGCPFTDLITSNAELLPTAAALLDPYNDRDLGALTASATVPQTAGLYPLGTVTIAAMPDVPPGTYTLSLLGAVGVNSAMQAVELTGQNYTIVVTDGSGGDTDDGTDDGGLDDGDTDDEGTGGEGGDGGTDDDGSDDGTDGSADDGDTADSDADGQADDGSEVAGDTPEDGSETGAGDNPLVPALGAVTRCGAGVGGTAMMGVMLGLWLMRPTGRRR